MPSWMDEDLAEYRRQGLFRMRRAMQSGVGAHVTYRGREFVNFTSNDYLALAADPRVIRAVTAAVQRYGCGAGASPLVSGYSPPLRHLERDLARWQGAEASLVFSSGFAANLAVIGSLARAEDTIFSDALNHASLIDGCRLSRACVHIYRHADMEHLEDLLANERTTARRRLIVTDTVFSMDGDLAPLPALVDLTARYSCLLVLDEAHATGVLGATGRGAVEFHLANQSYDVDRVIKIGTLSKALGSQGGFVCGSRQLCRWLINRARPYIFSTALAVPSAAAARAAVAIAQTEPDRRQNLSALGARLRTGLRAHGYNAPDGITPIIPLIVGDAAAALALSRRLERDDLLVPAIRPPSVPRGTARLRISLTAGHTEEDVQRLLEALRQSL